MMDATQFVAVPLADLQQLLDRPTQRFFNIAQAAQYSGLSDKSIRRLISAGKLASHAPVRKRILIDRMIRNKVHQWTDAEKNKPPKTAARRSTQPRQSKR